MQLRRDWNRFKWKKKRLGRRKTRRQNAAAYRRLKKAQMMYRKRVKLTAKYRKQCQRMRAKKASVPSPFQTPRTKVLSTLKKSHSEVRKRLLFGVSQLQHNLKMQVCSRQAVVFTSNSTKLTEEVQITQTKFQLDKSTQQQVVSHLPVITVLPTVMTVLSTSSTCHLRNTASWVT